MQFLSRALVNLGQLMYLVREDYDEAENLIKAAVEADPMEWSTLMDLATVCLKLSDFLLISYRFLIDF